MRIRINNTENCKALLSQHFDEIQYCIRYCPKSTKLIRNLYSNYEEINFGLSTFTAQYYKSGHCDLFMRAGLTMRRLLEKFSFKQTAIGVADPDVSISIRTKLYAWVRIPRF
jgi:hypothetical protein